jgi:hypothetical protein
MLCRTIQGDRWTVADMMTTAAAPLAPTPSLHVQSVDVAATNGHATDFKIPHPVILQEEK